MVKKVMTTNLDSSKASGPSITPVVVLKTYEPEFSYILPDFVNIEVVLFSRLLECLISDLCI